MSTQQDAETTNIHDWVGEGSGRRRARGGSVVREVIASRIARVAARWNLTKAAAVAVTLALLLHETVYHLTGGSEFPLTVLFNGTRVFVMSHGGLDSLVVGAIIVGLIALHGAAKRYVAGER